MRESNTGNKKGEHCILQAPFSLTWKNNHPDCPGLLPLPTSSVTASSWSTFPNPDILSRLTSCDAYCNDFGATKKWSSSEVCVRHWLIAKSLVANKRNARNCEHKKTLCSSLQRVLGLRAWRWPTLTWGNPTLPSALSRFTSEFGMGSGGSNSLWSSSNSVEFEGLRMWFHIGLDWLQ